MSEAKIIHGAKIRIYPNRAQVAQFDRWRRGCLSLWNLLLGMEQAAYSGEKFRPELKWRQKWIEVAEGNYPKLLVAFNEKQQQRDEAFHYALADLRSAEEAVRRMFLDNRFLGKTVEEILSDAAYAEHKAVSVLREAYSMFKKAAKAKTGDPPQPVAERRLAMLGRGRSGGAPKLFLWQDELLKTMARLKKEPLGSWIADIPSHAAQQVCKDLVGALSAMLRERRKRASGQGGRDTGFPRFKKTSAYAEGSVYFANTQLGAKPLFFDHGSKKIKFPGGVGFVPRGDTGHIPPHAKLMGARLFREGEKWWLSAQFQFAAPDPLPKTEKECGLKIAATTIVTLVDTDGNVFRVPTPREPRRHAFQMNLASKSLSRRCRYTKAYKKQAAKLAYQHSRNRNVRDDLLHKTSRTIADSYDAISIQTMDVASMMEKDPDNKAGRSLRKANRRAAMARVRMLLDYKTAEAGRLVNHTPALQPIVQECSGCGTLHYMPLEKRVMDCYRCGTKLERSVNAAHNELSLLQAAKAAGEAL